MNQKDLEYISRLFQKISSKPIELYVLTRLWHQLDDFEIQMIPQQYVDLPEKGYAMSDIYFPQVNIFVEINEPAHYETEWSMELDRQRNENISRQTGTEVRVIDCRPSLQEIHQQIDQVVEAIKLKAAVSRQSGIFKRWRPNEARDPLYWKSQKIIRVEDDVILNNVEAICQLFNADFNKTKRGFLRRGAIAHPSISDYLIWWPSAFFRNDWKNDCLESGEVITELHKALDKNSSHYHNTIKWPHKRILFYHKRDVLGIKGYYFMGIYEIDFNLSNECEGLFWRRISKEIALQ